LIITVVALPSEDDSLYAITGFLTMAVIPITLLVIGIKKRVKYIKEKKRWKECTDSGKREIDDVFKEFQEMENEYHGS
jgi:hypothetical protein